MNNPLDPFDRFYWLEVECPFCGATAQLKDTPKGLPSDKFPRGQLASGVCQCGRELVANHGRIYHGYENNKSPCGFYRFTPALYLYQGL